MIPQAEYILDLQKQLTLLSSEPRNDMNGGISEEESITSMTPLEKVSFMLSIIIFLLYLSNCRDFY